MIIEDLEQGSPEWLAMRVGIVTASRLRDVMELLKDPKKESEKRAKYRKELIWENLTGVNFPKFVTQAMETGTFNEPFGRAEYELKFGVDVDLVGFALHPTIKKFGASPDGLVGKDGLIEIKCPGPMAHIETVLSGEIPADYQWQMLGELACTEREWCDYVSYDSTGRMPEKCKLFVKRFYRDKERIARMEAEVQKFIGEMEKALSELKVRPEIPHTLQGQLEESLKAI